MIAVKAVPASKKTMGGIPASIWKSSTSGKVSTALFMSAKPNSSRPKPHSTPPRAKRRRCDSKNTTINPPHPSSGKAIAASCSLKPSTVTSQPVNVVPKLAPSTAPKAWASGKTFAPTMAISMRVTSELLCRNAVTQVPVAIAAIGFLV